jgi:8-oxo-dGTP diphosphatase
MPENIDFKNAASTASLIITDGIGLFLVKRKHNPYKGRWALPGGFHECDKESLEDTAVRELKEETNINVSKKDLTLICVNSDPDRDPRGHVIDHVYLCMDYEGSPEAGSDAKELKYHYFKDLPELAFDHKKSIDSFLILMGTLIGTFLRMKKRDKIIP